MNVRNEIKAQIVRAGYTMQDVVNRQIERHNERTKEKYNSNPDIDTSRSHLNFHLVTPERKYRAEAEKQIAEAGCHAFRCEAHKL